MQETQLARRRALKIFSASAMAMAASGAWRAASAASQGFGPELPPGPVRLIVPYTPGTGIDLIGRTISPILSRHIDRPVVVDNRAGASGNIGTEAVVRSAPNGQTLMVSVNTLVMNRSLYPSLPFDPLSDLTPISLTSWGQLVLVANAGTGYRSARDFIDAARKRPGVLNYASPGVGTPHHLAMELLNNQAGISTLHVPYRGTSQALTDLLGGQVQAMVLPIHVALPHIRAGKLTPLGLCSAKRHELLADVPTLAEAGVPDVDVDMWYGVFGPAGLPADLVNAYNKALRGILAMPEIKTAFETQGMVPASSTPAEFKAIVEKDEKRWGSLIRAKNIRAD